MAKKQQLPKHVYNKGRINKYLYFEKRGWPTIKFKNQDANHPDFYAEYAAIIRGDIERPLEATTSDKRTFNKLIESYRNSYRYKKLKPSSLGQYDRALAFFEKTIGHVNPKILRRKDVIKMRDSQSHRPRFGDSLVQVIRIVFEHAIDMDWVETNHAKKVQLIGPTKEARQPWPPALVDEFRKVADPRTLLLFELLLGTGQRIGDVLEMQWQQIVDGGVYVTQNKTGKLLWIPFGSRLLTLLGNTKKQSMFIVTKPSGNGPLSYHGAQKAVKKYRQKIGAEKYDIHSLRYTAASEMASNECTDEEIASVTGQTLEMVQHYTKAVRQKANAIKAIAARERVDKKLGHM